MPLEREGADPLNGGLVTGVPPHMVGGAESPDCTNTDPADPWGMTTRAGSAAAGSALTGANSGISGDASYLANAGTLVVRGASQIYKINYPFVGAYAATSIFSIVNNASVVGAGAASIMDVAWGFAPLGSAYVASTMPWHRGVITVDTMTPRIYNVLLDTVSTASLPSTDLVYSFTEIFANRAWLAGVRGDFPNAVRHSALNDVSDWTTTSNAGRFLVGGGANDEIVSVKATRNAIYWFMRSQLWLTTGTGPLDFETELVTNNLGCVSVRGTCSDGQGAYFASDDGIYYVNGLNVTRISDKERAAYLAIPDKSKIVLAYKGEKLYCFHNSSGASVNDSAIVAAPRRKIETGDVQAIWAKWGSLTIGAAFVSASVRLYGVSNASTLQVYELETGSGASNILTYNSPHWDFREPEAKKQGVWFNMHVRPLTTATQTWTVQLKADGASVGSSYSIDIASGASHAYVARPGRASWVGNYLGIELSSLGQRTLYGVNAYAEVQAEGDYPRVRE